MELTEIPFSTFEGLVRQLRVNSSPEALRLGFETAFPTFFDNRFDLTMFEQQVTADGTIKSGKRARRFAGDETLPRERYFSLCDDQKFNDFGTLKREMLAYYDECSGVDVMLYDSLSEPKLKPERLAQFGLTEKDTEFFLVLMHIVKETQSVSKLKSHMSLENERSIGITYGFNKHLLQTNRAIDLRLPETQEWFTKTFVSLERARKLNKTDKQIFLMPPDEIQSFGELLPSLLSPEIGGPHTFTQAIGAWMRAHNVALFVFPSARSNAMVDVEDGVIQKSCGWNVVVYDGSPSIRWENLFGNSITLYNRKARRHIKIDYIASGSRKGSFCIRGVEEWNMIKFYLKREELYERKKDNPSDFLLLATILGMPDEQITRSVEKLLEGDEEGDHWYRKLVESCSLK